MAKHILAILNQKGGVGKTTTTLNLGSYLAKAGKKVLIIDLDPQGNATSGLGLDKYHIEGSTYHVLLGEKTVGEVVRPTNVDNLFILPTEPQMAAVEVELVGHMAREQKLKSMLGGLEYDVVLIDCPPSLGLLTVNALTAATHVLIPVQTEYYALEGLGQLMDVMQRVRQALNPHLQLLGVVLTMYDSRTSLSEQVKAEVTKHFTHKVFETVIPRNVRLAEAPSYGKTIAEHDKWSKGARAYKALAKEVEKRLG